MRSWAGPVTEILVAKARCAVPENIHTPPTEGIGISCGNVSSLIGISRGAKGVGKNPFCGGGMDILWNYTLSITWPARMKIFPYEHSSQGDWDETF